MGEERLRATRVRNTAHNSVLLGLLSAPMSNVFVTVGTTSFEALVNEVFTEACARVLREKHGVGSVTVQLGRSEHLPPAVTAADPRPLPPLESRKLRVHGLDYEVFRFRPWTRECIDRAAFVISHAGAIALPAPLFFDSHGPRLGPPDLPHSIILKEMIRCLRVREHFRRAACEPAAVRVRERGADGQPPGGARRGARGGRAPRLQHTRDPRGEAGA